jgi:type IV secretory pathway TrbF-like protein
MTDPSEAVLAYWNEHRQHLRHSEDQRAVLTNYVLVITSALIGLAVQQHLQVRTLPLALLVTGIGLYGALTVAKYHERAEYHLCQARALTRIMKELGALPADETLLEEYRQAHYSKYPRLRRIRLHTLWTGLHLAIAGIGLVLSVLIVTL